MRKYPNLNALSPRTTDMGGNTREQSFRRALGEFRVPAATKVCAYFSDLEQHLIAHIRSSDAVVGCVAWLTSPATLKALASKMGTSVLVQKEDFLRPDLNNELAGHWKDELRRLYDSIPPIRSPEHFQAGWLEEQVKGSPVGLGQPIESVGIRCVGHKRGPESAIPRMHHKFLVFLRRLADDDSEVTEGAWPYSPYAVWTGSFNITTNGAASLENAIFIEDPSISEAYRKEWEHVLRLSEPLDWNSEYASPSIYYNTGACIS